MTTITTTNPVRSDVVVEPASVRSRQSRLWALSGIGAALAGIGPIVTSSAVSAVYDPSLTTPEQIAAVLETQVGWMFAFHSITVVGAILMIVFGAGLYRRLRSALPSDSVLPLVAFAGMLGTAVVSILGSGLDTVRQAARQRAGRGDREGTRRGAGTPVRVAAVSPGGSARRADPTRGP